LVKGEQRKSGKETQINKRQKVTVTLIRFRMESTAVKAGKVGKGKATNEEDSPPPKVKKGYVIG